MAESGILKFSIPREPSHEAEIKEISIIKQVIYNKRIDRLHIQKTTSINNARVILV